MDSDDFSDDSTTSEEEEEYESYMDESNFNEKLIESVINEDYEEVEKYLKHGADPNTTDYRGITPLNYAVMSDDSEESIDIIRILLEYSAQINFKENTSFGNTALMVAALYNYDVVKYLLERGADPFLVNNKGNTAYDNAIQNGNMKIARLIHDRIKLLEDDIDPFDEPSDPDIDLLRDEAARYIQTIMRARIETDKKRKLTKRRYGKWASPKTEREKDRRYMDLIRQINVDDPIRGYARYLIYPERLLPTKKGGRKRNKKYKKKYKTKNKGVIGGFQGKIF